jgi:hypothetical protein
VPSVKINDVTGNPFQPDVQYRGFTASPVLGTPQGLAIYQNGVRTNEAFGDTVNWDLIPEFAIDGLEIVSNNPAFGLNALGGALAVQMKNGFTFHDFGMELYGGAFGRMGAMAEAGIERRNIGVYLGADTVPGEIDRTQTTADGFGGAPQLTSTATFFGSNNHFAAGGSLDHGRVDFGATSELGAIDRDLVVTGRGVFFGDASDGAGPVQLLTTNTYAGAYVTDTPGRNDATLRHGRGPV